MKMYFTRRLRALHPGSLFMKIACIVVPGVLIVSVFTLGAAFQTTRQGYVETMSRSNEQIMAMVREKMEAMNDRITDVELTINNSWAFSQYMKSDEETPQTFVQVYDMIKQLNTVRPDTFYDVAVVGVNGRSYVSNGTSLSMSAEELLRSKITQDARQHPNQILYRYVGEGITRRSQGGSAFVALKALTYPGSQTAYGFAYVVMRQQDLQAFFDGLSNGTNNLMLMDDSGVIVSSPNSAIVGRKNEELSQIVRDMDTKKETGRYTQLQDMRALVLTNTMPRWNLHIVSAFDYTRALNEMSSTAYILMICLLVTAAVLIAVFLIIRQITRPINRLVRTMETVTREGLPDHVEVIGGGYEVRQLSSAFEVMIENLNRYVGELIQMEQEKRRMEIHTLQMQINPHFIYNTLTSIKWLIWQKDSEKAVQSIDTFTLLLRSTISDSQRLIPASEEVENLKNYVFLQKIRFGRQIQTDIFLSSSAADCLMPKLLLQPFLENSFFHAFTNRPQGVVSVLIDCHGENLICEVIDDGVGMPQSKADELLGNRPNEGGRSIGIPNVNARIQLLFGEQYGVKIFSEPGHGTSVKVTLPIVREDDTTEKS
jgi:Predicted signal transduction protein with a C-terminal ATPase domain